MRHDFPHYEAPVFHPHFLSFTACLVPDYVFDQLWIAGIEAPEIGAQRWIPCHVLRDHLVGQFPDILFQRIGIDTKPLSISSPGNTS